MKAKGSRRTVQNAEGVWKPKVNWISWHLISFRQTSAEPHAIFWLSYLHKLRRSRKFLRTDELFQSQTSENALGIKSFQLDFKRGSFFNVYFPVGCCEFEPDKSRGKSGFEEAALGHGL